MQTEDLLKSLSHLSDPVEIEREVVQEELGKIDLSGVSDDTLKALSRGETSDRNDDETLSKVAIHAYRALAMRRQPGDLPFFVELLHHWEDTYLEEMLWEDFEWVFEQLGEEIVPLALEIISDTDLKEGHRAVVAENLEKFSKKGIGTDEILSVYQKQLAECRPDRELNGNLIAALIQQSPESSQDVILAAYDTNVVDVSVNGDREQVEIDLGVRTERETPGGDLFELERHLVLSYRRKELGEFPKKNDAFAVLDYLLQLYRDDDVMDNISVLDGFIIALTGVAEVISPALINPWIWDSENGTAGDGPTFENTEEEELFNNALEAYYAKTIKDIDDMTYAPALCYFGDPARPLASPLFWATGVEAAICCLRRMEDPSDFTSKLEETMGQIYIACRQNQEMSEDEAVVACRETVAAIYIARQGGDPLKAVGAYTRSKGFVDQMIRQEPKIGRNDPCPCGSGKKYKKCCAN